MSALSSILSWTFLAQTMRAAVPYACAALGGVVSERSGVVNIALEGELLLGGLAAIAVNHATDSPWLGVLAAALTGASMNAVHGAVVLKGRVNAIVSGLALNLVAAGGTRVVLRALYDSSSNSPSVPGFRSSMEGHGSVGLLVRTLIDPMTLLSVAIALVIYWLLARTRFGLRVRACGEDPEVARSAGVGVLATRMNALVLAGVVTGMGGAALAFEQHQFQSGMSGGRGFIALAAVILSGWRPLRAVGYCLVFAALDSLEFVLQDQKQIPTQLVQMLPYAATLVALAFSSGRRQGHVPAALGS